MTKEFKIQNFSDVQSFSSVNEIENALRSKYRGMHVSIIYASKLTGLRCSIFVSVNSDGVVFYTYGDEAEVNFNKLNLG
ncbi:hypothetical protein [Pseudoalteromonas sp. TAB23]|uniref:hypothetical protein n=1 Tax=Pseudoalteromonas sp. TAB23 TaxID=1938595 RepID=UPI000413F8F4|nr:hypothetical protein [Pseudoalteromonas sp. TAB23]